MTVLDPTVFVIDDDPSVRKGLARLLRSLGFNTETFASAELFLAREPFEGIGCIVLDVRMPGRSGMDLQEDLNQANPGMPIIFITGHGTIPMTVQAMKSGAVDFLTKPFHSKDLLAVVPFHRCADCRGLGQATLCKALCEQAHGRGCRTDGNSTLGR